MTSGKPKPMMRKVTMPIRMPKKFIGEPKLTKEVQTEKYVLGA